MQGVPTHGEVPCGDLGASPCACLVALDRAIAGETLAYFHQRVGEVHGEDTPVLAMGEFNDEPFDLSLVQYALSTRQRAKVLGGTSPRL